MPRDFRCLISDHIECFGRAESGGDVWDGAAASAEARPTARLVVAAGAGVQKTVADERKIELDGREATAAVGLVLRPHRSPLASICCQVQVNAGRGGPKHVAARTSGLLPEPEAWQNPRESSVMC